MAEYPMIQDKIPYIAAMTVVTLLVTLALYFNSGIKLNRGNLNVYYLMEKILSFTGGSILVIFSSFRVIDLGIGGSDAYTYKIYHSMADLPILEALQKQNYEYGYGLIVWLFRKLSSNYVIFLIFIYLFLYMTMVKFLKEFEFCWLTAGAVFLILMLIINSFNTIRVMLAVFLGIRVYLNLYEKKYKKALAIAVVSATMHISALILFPIIWCVWTIENKNKVRLYKLYIYIIAGMAVAYFLSTIATSYVSQSKYYVYDNAEGISTGTYLIVCIVFLLSILKYNKISTGNAFAQKMIIALPVCLVVLPLQMKYSILYRMTLYFLPVIYALIPCVVSSYNNKKEWISNIIVKVGLVGYMAYRIYSFFSIEIYSSGVPYYNMLFK